MRKPLSAASRRVAPGNGAIGRLANGLLSLFDDQDRQPDYDARRDRVRGPLLSNTALNDAATATEDQSSSSASQ